MARRPSNPRPPRIVDPDGFSIVATAASTESEENDRMALAGLMLLLTQEEEDRAAIAARGIAS